MGDVVAELRELLAAAGRLEPVGWELDERAVACLPALLDVVDAAREVWDGGARPDGSWGRLGHALARLEGEGP